jgi:large repetitive protein
MRWNRVLITATAIAAVVAIAWLRSDTRKRTAAATSTRAAAVASPRAELEAAAVTAWHADSVGAQLLEGQVLDREDRPVGGAVVTVNSQPPRAVITEADGSFSVPRLVSRRYEVTASAPSGVAGPVVVRLDGDTEPVLLRLVAPGRVEARVIDATTRTAIANADVEVRAPILVTGRTGPDGRTILMPVVRGHWNVVARAPGHARGHVAVIIGPQPTAITLALVPGTTLRGRVTDSRGKAIAGARVWAASSSDWTAGASAERDGVDAGSDGAFVIDGIKPGTYRLHGRARGYANGISGEVAVGDGPVDAGALALRDAATLRGRVVHGDGRPAAGAEVKVFLPETSTPVTHAGDDGAFTIADLPRAIVKVGAEGRGASCWSQRVNLEAGDAEVTLRLDLDHSISGVVVDRTEQPVEGAQIGIALVQPGARFVREELTDGAGRFRIAGLPEGDYDVVATRPGVERAPTDVATRIRTGGSARIVLGAPGSILGRLAFADGPAPALATTRLTAGGEHRVITDGKIAITDVSPGRYSLRFEGPDFVTTPSIDVVVADGQPTDIGTIQVEHGRTVEGVVVDTTGRPVATATVLAGPVLVGTGTTADSGTRAPGFQGEIKRVHTAADGRFTLHGLSAIPLSIVAEHASLGRSSPVTLDASASAPLRLVLAPTASIAGAVKHAGQPIAAPIVAQPHASPLAMSIVLAGADGTFHVDRIAPGRYSIAASAGDPLSGAPLAPVGLDVAAGLVAQVDLEAVLGTRRLDVTTAGRGIVFVTTEPIDPRTGLDLVTRLGMQTRGHWAMHAASGSARFASLMPTAYTACAVPIDEAIADINRMLQLLSTQGASLAVVCRAVAADDAAISLRGDKAR